MHALLILALVAATWVSSGLARAQAPTAVSLQQIEFGPASIEGDERSFFYLKGVVNATSTGTRLAFKHDSLVLYAANGQRYLECWVRISDFSAGLSVGQIAPVSSRSLAVSVQSGGTGKAGIAWNTSRVSGPNGELEYKIPAGGHVEFTFLWPVPKGFKASKVQLAGVKEVALK